mmetsp:Transcript_23583/g.58454  ORF Transcript_23583/g.58454 Transcript_23583/m.58454 type:complete len:405 (+) Transcript_23583:1003-2217(+)
MRRPLAAAASRTSLAAATATCFCLKRVAATSRQQLFLQSRRIISAAAACEHCPWCAHVVHSPGLRSLCAMHLPMARAIDMTLGTPVVRWGWVVPPPPLCIGASPPAIATAATAAAAVAVAVVTASAAWSFSGIIPPSSFSSSSASNACLQSEPSLRRGIFDQPPFASSNVVAPLAAFFVLTSALTFALAFLAGGGVDTVATRADTKTRLPVGSLLTSSSCLCSPTDGGGLVDWGKGDSGGEGGGRDSGGGGRNTMSSCASSSVIASTVHAAFRSRSCASSPSPPTAALTAPPTAPVPGSSLSLSSAVATAVAAVAASLSTLLTPSSLIDPARSSCSKCVNVCGTGGGGGEGSSGGGEGGGEGSRGRGGERGDGDGGGSTTRPIAAVRPPSSPPLLRLAAASLTL